MWPFCRQGFVSFILTFLLITEIRGQSDDEMTTTEAGVTETTVFPLQTMLSQKVISPANPRTGISAGHSCGSDAMSYVPKGFLPEHYNSLEVPPKIATLNESDFIPQTNRTGVVVLMAISKLRGLDEKEEELTLEIDFEIMWRDGRLNPFVISNATKPQIEPLNPKILEKIWHPHIYIEQLVSNARPALITAPTKLNIFTVEDPYVHFGLRSDVVTACEMDYRFYPVDVTKCRIDIKSYQYEIATLFLQWPKGREGVLIPDDIDFPGFDVHILGKSNTTLPDIHGYEYSTLGFTIALKRHISYHVIQTYLPSLIFIVISWGSFLIPDESATERIGCALVSLLSLMVMLDSIGQTIPQVTYLTALHIWMIACIVFVFIPLIEVLLVFKLWSLEKGAKKREAKQRKDTRRTIVQKSKIKSNNSSQVNILIDDDHAYDPMDLLGQGSLQSKKIGWWSTAIEQKLPIIMPSLFAVFNAIYWPWLLTGDPIEDENISSFVKQ